MKKNKRKRKRNRNDKEKKRKNPSQYDKKQTHKISTWFQRLSPTLYLFSLLYITRVFPFFLLPSFFLSFFLRLLWNIFIRIAASSYGQHLKGWPLKTGRVAHRNYGTVVVWWRPMIRIAIRIRFRTGITHEQATNIHKFSTKKHHNTLSNTHFQTQPHNHTPCRAPSTAFVHLSFFLLRSVHVVSVRHHGQKRTAKEWWVEWKTADK